MRYCLVYLLRGRAEEFSKQVSRKIAEIFDIPCVSDKVRPHMTIKAPFEIEGIGDIEKILSQISQKEKLCNTEFSGFHHFDNRTIFMKVAQNEGLSSLHEAIYNGLKTVKGLTWERYDRPGKRFHVTVADDIPALKYDSVWEYVSRLPDFRFPVNIDRLTLLRKEYGRYKEFKGFDLSKA